MRYALFSDVHGNLPALEAVLSAIRAHAVDQIVCLGDIVNAGPFPAACLDLVRSLNCPIIQGNHELYVLKARHEAAIANPAWATARWTADQLSDQQVDFLACLPARLELDSAYGHPAICVHASPADVYRGFMPGQDDQAISSRMNGEDGVTLFAGHTHRPLYRRWSRSWIVNVGSVGMPLDGTTLAKYCLATDTPSGWQVEFHAAEYDLRGVLDAFDSSGLQEYGGVFAALFRYQMATGEVVITDFLEAVGRFALLHALPLETALARFPVPATLRPWWPGENGLEVIHG